MRKTILLATTALATTALAACPPAAHAQTINVSGGGNALQAAIASAPAGATIVVTDSATYSPITVSTSNLTIEAASGAAPVINVPQTASAGIDINANGTTVQGFTINGDAQSLSLAQANALGATPATTANGINIGSVGGPIITNTKILNNTVAYMPGGGIQSMYADYLTIQGNTVHDNANYSPYGESGISVYASQNSDGSTANKILVLNNTVYNNKELVIETATGRISDGEGIIIDDNSNSQTDGVQYTGGTLVQGNTTYGNGSEGIQVGNSSYVQVIGNNAYGNNTVINGGGSQIATPNSYAVTQSGDTGTPGATPAAPVSTATTLATPAAVAQPAAAPAAAASAGPVSTCAATPGGAAGGGFTTSNGQIIAPDGSVFIAKGIGVIEGNEPSLSTLQADFPGINFVRYAIYDYAGPAALSGFVTSLTSAGIVVEIEDHNNGAGNAGGGQGVIFTGRMLTTELNWYTAIAKAFASNPAVWFGTNNEPSEVPSAAALSTWQGQTYQAIRGTGNASPVMVEMNCWNSPVMTCGQGYTASVYATMTNIIWDDHYYGWLSNYSTDQAAVTQSLSQEISASQQITGGNGTVPVLIGEYGNSTSGTAIDPNAQQVLSAVQSSGFGSAAWAWGGGNPGDGLSDGGTGLSSYGREAGSYIALIANAPASIWTCPETSITLAQGAGSGQTADSAAASDALAATTAAVAATTADVTAADGQATQSMADTQRQIDALQPRFDRARERIQALRARIAAGAAQ
jgi:hypothetical protein